MQPTQDGGRDKFCPHLKYIAKDTLKTIAQIEATPQCEFHNHPMYYLCLHCGRSCCLDYQQQLPCLSFHFKINPTHYFALEMEVGAIWCNQCNDSIQGMIFSYQKQDQNYLKMNRFVNFISGIWKQLSKKDDKKKVVALHRGLRNLGNTCFLNSVLQCLSATSPLKELYQRYNKNGNMIKYSNRFIPKYVQFFYNDMIEKGERQRWNIVTSKRQKKESLSQKIYNREIKNGEFSLIMKHFLLQMETQTGESLNPSNILDYLSTINNKYHLNEQQDAQQLLLLVIDLLSESERVCLLQDHQRYKEVQKLLGFQKLAPIQSIFGFYLLNQIQCSQCKQITFSMNLTYNVGISLDSQPGQSYQIEHKQNKIDIDFWQDLQYPAKNGKCGILDPFFQMERLNMANNYYSCGKCKSVVSFRKHYIIDQPQVLVISAKRFNSQLQKNSGKVPLEQQIDIGHLCAIGKQQNKGSRYSLYGVVVHEGKTLTSGHYVSFIKLGESWLLCSDHRVQVVDWKYVQRQEAYVLFYQRMDQKI